MWKEWGGEGRGPPLIKIIKAGAIGELGTEKCWTLVFGDAWGELGSRRYK